MCITFLFINDQITSNSKYKMILVNNRDEFYKRATSNASVMVINNDIKSIYGVDLAAAHPGTWLGISKNKNCVKLGNLANVTGEEAKGTKGRGSIVTDWINNDNTLSSYNQDLFSICEKFNSFNFISVIMDDNNKVDGYYISNSPKNLEKISTGFIGLGNSPLKSPFKKVEVGVELFKNLINEHQNSSKDELIKSLKLFLSNNERHFPDDELSKRKPEEPERYSSIHIELKEHLYGTRTRTIILVDENNNIDYIEETMVDANPDGEWTETRLKL
jgi:uncharacterized protein with NRDE domain